jgi:hypothetical protein
VKAATLGPVSASRPARRACLAKAERTRLRQLTWALGLLGVILVGQANEFSAAYLDNGRIFSPVALGLCLFALVWGLRLLPEPRFGLPLGLLVSTLGYTLVVGTLVSAPLTSLDSLWSDAGRLMRALVALLCIFVGAQAVLLRGDIRTIILALTTVAAAVVAYQVASFLLGHQPSIGMDETSDDTFRYSGIFGNPNQAASFCVLLVCMSLLAPLSTGTRILLGGLALAGLVSTFSRGGLVTFAAVAAANAFLGPPRGRLAFIIALIAAGTITFLVVPTLAQSGAMPPGMAKHVMGLYNLVTGQAEFTDNSRGMLVVKALNAIDEHSLSGYGFGRYYSVIGKGSHNMYTHFALLAGVPAALLYTTSIGTLGWCGLKLKDQAERRFVVSLAAWMAAMGLSSHNLFDEKYSVLLIGMACAIVAVRLAPPTTLRPASATAAARWS